jgi:hypothetical protein
MIRYRRYPCAPANDNDLEDKEEKKGDAISVTSIQYQHLVQQPVSEVLVSEFKFRMRLRLTTHDFDSIYDSRFRIRR